MEREYEVIVHKANLPIMKNESLNNYISALYDAGKAWAKQKYNIPDREYNLDGDVINSGGGCYVVEAFSDKAVFMIIPDYSKPSANDFMVAAKYVRNSNGEFEFSDAMKVVKVVTYETDPGVPITKALGMDNWTPVPSIFAGVV